METSGRKQLSLRVSGRVQGVNFRAFVRDTALHLRLSGYAKNLPDGTVEVVATGEEEPLRRLSERISAAPPPIYVESITEQSGVCEEAYVGFTRL